MDNRNTNNNRCNIICKRRNILNYVSIFLVLCFSFCNIFEFNPLIDLNTLGVNVSTSSSSPSSNPKANSSSDSTHYVQEENNKNEKSVVIQNKNRNDNDNVTLKLNTTININAVDLELPTLDDLVETSELSSFKSCPDGFIHFNDVKLPATATTSVQLPDQRIPRIIHFTTKSRCVSPEVHENLKRWAAIPNYEIYLHDDIAVDRLLRYASHSSDNTTGACAGGIGLCVPFLKQALSCASSDTTISDIWRLLVLWYYGGIYSDIDNAPGPKLKNFGFIQPYDNAFFISDDDGYDDNQEEEHSSSLSLSQFFIASCPYHPMLKHSLHAAVVGLLTTDNVMMNKKTPEQTGPGAIKRGFIEFRNALGTKTNGYLHKNGKFIGGIGSIQKFGPNHNLVIKLKAGDKASLFLEIMGLPLNYDIDTIFNDTTTAGINDSKSFMSLDQNKKWSITIIGSKSYIQRKSINREKMKEYYEKADMLHFLDGEYIAEFRKNEVLSCVEHIRRQQMQITQNGAFYERVKIVLVKNETFVGKRLLINCSLYPNLIQKETAGEFGKAGLLSKHRNVSHHNCYYFTGLGDRPCVCLPVSMVKPKAWAKPASSEVNVFIYQNDVPFGGVHSIADHSWIEVMRWKNFVGPNGDGGQYGTWFYAMPGSGIHVNIGNALRFSNRTEAEIRLKPDGPRIKGALGAPDDWYYCIAAHRLGYDTVMIDSDDSSYVKHSSGLKRGQVELTVCGDTLNNTNTLCPSFEVRTADNQACNCDEAQSYLTCKEGS